MTDLDSIPDDADGETGEDPDRAVLRRLAEDGNDLSKFMVIDFHVIVPDQEVGLEFAEAAKQAGFKTELSYDQDDDEFTAWCSKLMLPEYQALIDAQVELAELALPFGSALDGWGTIGNAEK